MTKIHSLALCLLIAGSCLAPLLTAAQAETASTQTISVSPTLFEMKTAPGQTWHSEIKVVNVNDYDLIVYPQVVNFAPLGETGRGDLIPVFEEETQGKTLAEWIDLDSETITVPRQQTAVVSFSVTVPDDAAPGGHYAAILIGTRPPVANNHESQVQTAQFVTSLLFVRVDGDVIEHGSIREFSTEKNIIQEPLVQLELRFENSGNVHLQPQGDIKIYNMWGQERGEIPINHQTHFGNVLPNSIRQFLFTWEGESSFFDIGRYQAVATLGFGDEKKQFVTQKTYFWIIPYTQIIVTVAVLVALWLFFSWVLKLYIRRMLLLSGFDPYAVNTRIKRSPSTLTVGEKKRVRASYHDLVAPLKIGLADLTEHMRAQVGLKNKLQALADKAWYYRIFILTLLVTMIVIAVIGLYTFAVSSNNQQYNVTINNPDADITLSSEEVFYNNLLAEQDHPLTEAELAETDVVIELVNSSGVIGTAAKVRLALEEKGYHIETLRSVMDENRDRTVIIYNSADQSDALALSQILNGALLSASDEAEAGFLTIHVGSDLE